MINTAWLCCCGTRPAKGCSVCTVTAWTVSGIAGVVTWSADCHTYYVEEFDVWVSNGLTGTVTYTLPGSVVVEFVGEVAAPNCCTWYGSTAWTDGGSVSRCPDCDASDDSPEEYRFRTEVVVTLCEVSSGSGLYLFRVVAIVRGESRSALFPSWTAFSAVTSHSSYGGPAVAWCEWTSTLDSPSEWCPDGLELGNADGLAPVLGLGITAPDCVSSGDPDPFQCRDTIDDWQAIPNLTTVTLS